MREDDEGPEEGDDMDAAQVGIDLYPLCHYLSQLGDQFAALRQLLQQNPQMIPVLLQQLNPQLAQQLAGNPEALNRLMNDPNAYVAGALSARDCLRLIALLSAAQQAGGAGGPMGGAPGGGAGGGGRHVVQLTQQEMGCVERVTP